MKKIIITTFLFVFFLTSISFADSSNKYKNKGELYEEGDIVEYNGKLYECVQTHYTYGDSNWNPEIAMALWIQIDDDIDDTEYSDNEENDFRGISLDGYFEDWTNKPILLETKDSILKWYPSKDGEFISFYHESNKKTSNYSQNLKKLNLSKGLEKEAKKTDYFMKISTVYGDKFIFLYQNRNDVSIYLYDENGNQEWHSSGQWGYKHGNYHEVEYYIPLNNISDTSSFDLNISVPENPEEIKVSAAPTGTFGVIFILTFFCVIIFYKREKLL